MLPVKQTASAFLAYFGVQLSRSARSQALRQLAGAVNLLNHPEASPRAAMECLGHATLALQLDWLLRECQIDCVLDVGANNGQFAAELRALGYRQRIASFEPMSACVATLRQLAARDEAWTIFPCGLGSTPGRRELNHFADPTFSSLHAINPDAPAEFGRLVEPTGTESIELRTLDAVWAEAVVSCGATRVLLKTDTQGHDLEVLRGGTRRLADCAAVMCQLSFAPIYADVPGYRDLLAFLVEHGFECTGIHPLSYRADRPAMIEANVLFINTALARQRAPARPAASLANSL